MQYWLAVLALARIIAGEAGGCPLEAKVAIAHVHHNRIVAGVDGGWYGDSDPRIDDIAVALVWSQLPDPSQGGVFAIGPGDYPKVKSFAGPVTGVWNCSPGDFVETRKGP